MFVLAGLLLAVASLIARFLPWACAAALALLGLVLGATVLGTAAAALGADLLGARTAILCLQLMVGLAAVLASRRLSRAPRRAGRGSLMSALPWSAGAAAAVIGLLQPLVPRLPATWTVVSTDIAEHLVLLGQLQERGTLSYEASGYPRGLHMLLALVSAPQAEPVRSEALLRQDLVLLASSVWIVLAVLLWGLAWLTLAYARRAALPRSLALTAGCLAPWLLLTNKSFQLTFIHLGATPSLVAVIALAALPGLLLLTSRVSPGLWLMVASASALLLAHLWQPLVLAPIAACAGMLVARRTGSAPRDAPWASRAGVLAVVAVAAAVSLPAFTGVERAGGVSIAAIPGYVPGAPPALMALTAVGALLAARRHDRSSTTAWLGGCVGLLAAYAVLLYGAGGQLGAYYPQKVLWFLCLALLPLIVVEALVASTRLYGWLLARVASVASSHRAVTWGTRAVAGSLLAALVLPGLLAPSSLLRAATGPERPGGAGERRIEVATAYAGAYAPAVTVPVAAGLIGGNPGAFVTSKLMRFMTGQPTNYGLGDEVCADVQRVAGTAPAVVVTDVAPSVLEPVMAKGGCGHVRVVQVDGERSADLGAQEDYIRARTGQLKETAR